MKKQSHFKKTLNTCSVLFWFICQDSLQGRRGGNGPTCHGQFNMVNSLQQGSLTPGPGSFLGRIIGTEIRYTELLQGSEAPHTYFISQYGMWYNHPKFTWECSNSYLAVLRYGVKIQVFSGILLFELRCSPTPQANHFKERSLYQFGH